MMNKPLSKQYTTKVHFKNQSSLLGDQISSGNIIDHVIMTGGKGRRAGSQLVPALLNDQIHIGEVIVRQA